MPNEASVQAHMTIKLITFILRESQRRRHSGSCQDRLAIDLDKILHWWTHRQKSSTILIVKYRETRLKKVHRPQDRIYVRKAGGGFVNMKLENQTVLKDKVYVRT